MEKTSTPDYSNKHNLTDMKDALLLVMLHPQKQVVDFLMQFARSYHVEPALPKQLSGMILN
jgi:hypothetical protein